MAAPLPPPTLRRARIKSLNNRNEEEKQWKKEKRRSEVADEEDRDVDEEKVGGGSAGGDGEEAEEERMEGRRMKKSSSSVSGITSETPFSALPLSESTLKAIAEMRFNVELYGASWKAKMCLELQGLVLERPLFLLFLLLSCYTDQVHSS